jgi:Poly A polymerase head domain
MPDNIFRSSIFGLNSSAAKSPTPTTPTTPTTPAGPTDAKPADDKKDAGASLFSSGPSSFASSWTSSRILGDLPTDAPIASTQASIAAGFAAPPPSPRIFPGARVKQDKADGASGKLLGYSTNGSFIVQTDAGKTERFAYVTPLPGQQFQAVGQSLPKSQIIQPKAAEAKLLQDSMKATVGTSKKTVDDAVQAIRGAGFEAFIAGGAVRDAVQGTTARDVDLSTTMWIKEVDKALKGFPMSFPNAAFGTMIIGRGTTSEVDVCSLKSSKGEFGLDLMEDIASRDFTINAMYYDPANGVILDPTGHGYSDASNKVLRPTCKPGDEQKWLTDNPSVVLRFLKFTLRGYTYDPALLQLMKDNLAKCVDKMDGVRLDRMLDSVSPSSNRKDIIKAEMARLGFPQSDIDVVFARPILSSLFGPSFFSSSFASSPSSRLSSLDDDEGYGFGPRSTPARTSTTSSVGSGLTSSSSRIDRLCAADTSLTPSAPSWSLHGGLAVAETHVGRLPLDEKHAEDILIEKGFIDKGQGRWEHADKSWILFFGGNVFRGFENLVFTGTVFGSGPK